MKSFPYLAAVVAAVLALGAAGCGAAAGQPDAGAMHNGGKPSAAIEVLLKSSGKTTSGALLPLQLEFRSRHKQAALEVEYRTEGALALQGAARVQLTTDQNGVATDTPQVQALADGVQYLNVFVTLGKQRRAVSIPITVGNAAPAQKSGGPAITTPQGESLIILPADGGKR